MATLLQKIQADAATQLPSASDCDGPLRLDQYRHFLELESRRLKLSHRAGAAGLVLCHAQTTVADCLLQSLWGRARTSLSTRVQDKFAPLTLVALGGYGRGELNPHSDLDLMLLHWAKEAGPSTPLPHLASVIDWIIMPLFDLRFKVGHSVRTIGECVELANRDMRTKTSLIEARLIVGDERLFAGLQRSILAKCVQGHLREYIQARLSDQTSRHAKFGNSPTMQEPDVKSGCGGLRDFQNLVWMAFFRHRTRSLVDLEQKGFITPQEAKHLGTAYDFLLRVRTELHYQTGRSVDVLSRALQPAVAYKLGYTDRSPRRRIESFMRHYYRHSRNVYLITRTL